MGCFFVFLVADVIVLQSRGMSDVVFGTCDALCVFCCVAAQMGWTAVGVFFGAPEICYERGNGGGGGCASGEAAVAAYHVGLDQLLRQQMCPLLQEPVRRLGQVVVGQAAGGVLLSWRLLWLLLWYCWLLLWCCRY